MEINKIYQESCLETIEQMERENVKVNVVLTSPPYNTSTYHTKDKYHSRYNKYQDYKLSDEEYIKKTINLFNQIDKILNKNGVVLYNLSYSAQKPQLYIEVISAIIENTNFTLADTIIWKKKSCIPDNASKNRLSRITEFIFVLCRKHETKTFQCNKELRYKGKGGCNVYTPILNYIEAKNNDGSNTLNKATFSTDLCTQLLNIYATEGDLVYDPFIGTGTTAVACKMKNIRYIGSEIDGEQVIYADERLKKIGVNN